VWHPTDESTLYGIGGDWITRSTDAGKTLAWYANGYNGIMLGGMFNFSPTSPDTSALFFQDYNGAFTLTAARRGTIVMCRAKAGAATAMAVTLWTLK
jgi:hypothetical protein